ncbi:MAG: aminotransferase class V-fold PLP-dependent enzyme [Ruminococcus flavefaciens]|nr:aminotransferase class V-fold PLP-dependent enzyme [Ruminococcus flavefaciens]
MINFAVGPVQSSEAVKKIGGEEVPYFRTDEFSALMLENEEMILECAGAGNNSRAVFITGSGTAAMEASVINAFSSKDKVLVVNGGSFGERFEKLCGIHGIPYTSIKLESGKRLHQSDLEKFGNKGYTGFLVNLHETSTGVLYDIDIISNFCKKNELFLIVDAISSFMADEIFMHESGIDMLLIGSQKALACPPGISVILMSENAVERVSKRKVASMYFNLSDALKNGERGQTPFTPAVGILRQIHVRLKEVCENGGVENEIRRVSELAEDFREKIKEFPFVITSESMSNAVTPLQPLNASAFDVFLILKGKYGIWVCPNGGDLKNQLFRVGHMGNLTKKDNETLIDAFRDMKKKGFI